MDDRSLVGKLVLVTGAARRIGRSLSLACAAAGADVVIHYGHAEQAAAATQKEIQSGGRRAWTLRADFEDADQVQRLIVDAAKLGSLFGLVNSAAIFEPISLEDTSVDAWERHVAVNLRAPFLLSQGFARQLDANADGRIVNVLDWRATLPGTDHFPYTISKAALAAMTKSLAQALAPRVAVNGLALGAILPPEGKSASPDIVSAVPAGRWGTLGDAERALIFLLTGPAYITGEIIHVDGGRHLV